MALLALRFRNIPIDAVYSSPLKRAYKTAEAVDLYHSLPIIKLPELMEVDVGALSGMKLDKAFSDYPVFAEKWQNSPQNCIFPEGETTAEVYDRAKKALACVKADCMGKTAVITSHGFLLRCMACEILEHDIERLSVIRIGGNILVRVAEQFLRQVAFIAEAHRFHAAVFADIKFRNRGVAADTNI